EPLAQKLPATNAPPATNVPPRSAEAEASPNQPGTNQSKQLEDEIKRLTALNARLEAKVQEALSVQPALLDPRELAKAEEQIKLLQKEKELFKVSLEQEKAKNVQPAGSVLEQEKRILADVKEKLAQQTELAGALRLENDNL